MLRLICAAVIGLGMLPAIAAAQDSSKPNEYRVIQAVDLPQSPDGDAYRSTARRAGARQVVTYASDIEGDLTGTPAKSEPKRSTTRRRSSGGNLNGFGVVLAVALVLGALLLIMKFGGGGTLLARAPRETSRQTQAPTSWNIDPANTAQDAASLLEKIAGMADRSAAMVLLLRHCLLAAGHSTQARFARSDTERAAFARLPKTWAHHRLLEAMLRQAELAHYGGRAVPDDGFNTAIAAARLILERGRNG